MHETPASQMALERAAVARDHARQHPYNCSELSGTEGTQMEAEMPGRPCFLHTEAPSDLNHPLPHSPSACGPAELSPVCLQPLGVPPPWAASD